MDPGVVAGVVAIGIVHGVLPDHGWPIAAAYALNRPRRWLYGTVAGLILGVGHLISSVVLVLAYYWVSGFAAFADGPWLRYVAGAMLIFLGIREYRHGGHGAIDGGHDHDDHDYEHSRDHERERSHHGPHRNHGSECDHGHGDENGNGNENGTHDHRDQELEHAHTHEQSAATANGESGLVARVRARLPGGGGANSSDHDHSPDHEREREHDHGHDHAHAHLTEDDAERGLVALGTTALLLGFAHEEPIQILAICVGTPFCLELMLVYSLAVVGAILAPTLLLIAGYERHRETVETYTPYLPTLTAVVLVGMGVAFLVGIF